MSILLLLTFFEPGEYTARGSSLMGEEELAVKEKLADPRTLFTDTTAQEAAVLYSNEMGLMASFLNSVASASRKVNHALEGFGDQTATS